MYRIYIYYINIYNIYIYIYIYMYIAYRSILLRLNLFDLSVDREEEEWLFEHSLS